MSQRRCFQVIFGNKPRLILYLVIQLVCTPARISQEKSYFCAFYRIVDKWFLSDKILPEDILTYLDAVWDQMRNPMQKYDCLVLQDLLGKQ